MRSLGTAARRGALLFGLAVVVAVPALALAGDIPALARLERGKWLVRSAAQSRIERTICLGDPALLLQIEHGAAGCSRALVTADEHGGTIQYTCRGRGYGRTSVRVETSTVATIDTQGLIDGRPFAYRATARKVSHC